MEYSRTFSAVPENFRKKTQKTSYQPNSYVESSGDVYY